MNELWIVSGSMCGQGDDTLMCVETQPGEDARDIFTRVILEDHWDHDDPPNVFISTCERLEDFVKNPVRSSDIEGASK